MEQKVIIIGLDGATFDVLGRWMADGRLPHLKALVAEGVSGELRSSVPPVTAPAWASFMTGKNPGKHGVFDFVIQDKTTYQFHPVDSRSCRARTLWEVIGDEGGRVVVLNVPLTHPPYPVNGALISDFLLARGRGEKSFPPQLLGEIEERFGPYHPDTVLPYFVASQTDEDVARFIGEYARAVEYKFQVAHDLWERVQPDFLMLHLYGNDQICHWLWHVFDPTHPWHRPGDAEKHLETILEYYRTFDREIGKLLDRVHGDVTLFIISDHGFGPVYKALDLNTWLYQRGYLVLKNRPVTRFKRLCWQAGLTPTTLLQQRWIRKGLALLAGRVLRDRSQGGVEQVQKAHTLGQLLLSFHDIDWSRTRAFSPFGFGQIRINVRGEWAEGCVSPGDEYERLKRELVDQLRALTDPETGESLDGAVFTREELYRGDYLAEAPDIFFVPVNGKYRPKSTGFTSNAAISSFWGMSGIHKMNGLLIGRGAALRSGARIDGAEIIDIFPSVLYLMGMPIPEDVDGKVLQHMFTGEFVHRHPIRFAERTTSSERASAGETVAAEEEEVLDRLRGLGYLD